jgi:hypothetical protein
MVTAISGSTIMGTAEEKEVQMAEASWLSIIEHLDRRFGTSEEEIYRLSPNGRWNMMPGAQMFYRGDKARPTCHKCGKVHRGEGRFIYLRRRDSHFRFPTRTIWTCKDCAREMTSDYVFRGRSRPHATRRGCGQP